MKLRSSAVRIAAIAALAALSASAQRAPQTPAQIVTRQFNGVHTKVLAMIKEFPDNKFDYRPNDKVRTFKEVAIHILSGAEYGTRSLKDPSAKWDDLEAKNFKSKADIVSAYEKVLADAKPGLDSVAQADASKAFASWASVMEHSAEHYGQLVVYYRLNGMVPPGSN